MLPATTPLARLRAGLAVRVSAPAAGRVLVRATVPGGRIGLTKAAARRPALVATGVARVAGARVINVKLKLTPLGRRSATRLKGATATVRITLGTRTLVRRLRIN